MKKVLIIMFIIAAIVAVVIYYRMPKVSISSIDWINKSVNYMIKAGGVTKSGVASINDSSTDKSPLGGGYSVYVYSNAGGSFNYSGGKNTVNPVIKIGITKNGQIIKGNTIDFINKTNSPSLTYE